MGSLHAVSILALMRSLLRRRQSLATASVIALTMWAVSAPPLRAQEIRGLAKIDARGDAVWGANITLRDSLGREAATTHTNRHGEFSVRAPAPGTYWLQLSARTLGRTSSPIFVLDSGATMYYEHIFRRTLSEMARGEDVSAQSILMGPFRDSTAGTIIRAVSTRKLTQVQVSVRAAGTDVPLRNAEIALVSVDPRFEQMIGALTDSAGGAGWRDLQQSWYRVVGRHIGFEPGGTESFPIIGESDSVHVVLRLAPVTLLDPVKVMEQRVTSFGFNLNLMRRYFLGGDALRERNRSVRNVDDLIMSLNIPGLGIRSGEVRSILMYRGQKVRVFILDGSRTNGELPLVEPTAVESLLFIPPNEAGAIFGPDASGGALMINTRRR